MAWAYRNHTPDRSRGDHFQLDLIFLQHQLLKFTACKTQIPDAHHDLAGIEPEEERMIFHAVRTFAEDADMLEHAGFPGKHVDTPDIFVE